jgi:hypothetical protein
MPDKLQANSYREMHHEMPEELEHNYNKFMMRTLKEWRKAKEAETHTSSDDNEGQQKKKKAKDD